MFELEGAHSYSHFLALGHSSYQIYSSHISWIDRRGYIHCSEFGRRHRSAVKVGDGAFAVDVGGSPESVMKSDRNTFRCGGGGYSFWRSFDPNQSPGFRRKLLEMDSLRESQCDSWV